MSRPPESPAVKCPTCGQKAVYSTSNPFRPFCSERCKLIDLGEWAKENYRIPDATPINEEFETLITKLDTPYDSNTH